ncbi:hypothetical protein [Chlamydia sp. 17-3921]|uniref:hypothetical protein n=1 Tax=Chlamydia sp. 17-3921 TaxID=2675798 RepID=UPI001918C607|nr:hypothetical protein [Chlamydia sp. 17-3921]
MCPIFSCYEEFTDATNKWPLPLRTLVIGRRYDYSELEHSPNRILPFKSMSIICRLYRSLPIISTTAGIIRLIEVEAGPVHPKDYHFRNVEILCGVTELLGLGILLLALDVLRCFLALILSFFSTTIYAIAKKIPCLSHKNFLRISDFSEYLGKISDDLL